MRPVFGSARTGCENLSQSEGQRWVVGQEEEDLDNICTLGRSVSESLELHLRPSVAGM